MNLEFSLEKKECHLFILWSNSRYKENEILADISQRFKIVGLFEITWVKKNVASNFSRFYDHSLPPNSEKERHAGSDEFLLVIVFDENPRYDYRDTSKGKVYVNSNMFDAKSRYRIMTGGGHKIHGTNNREEFRHDVVMILGVSEQDLLAKKMIVRDNEPVIKVKLIRDIVGADGWTSFKELFYVLRECGDYVILRNSRKINEQNVTSFSGDIDLLVNDKKRFQYVLGDLSFIESNEYIQGHVHAVVNNCLIKFEIIDVVEGIYSASYCSYLMSSKVIEDGVSILPERVEKYALLYHALLFSAGLSQKHRNRLENSFESLKKENLLLDLDMFLESNKIEVCVPKDSRKYFNIDVARKIKNFRGDGVFKYMLLRRLCKLLDIKRERNRIIIYVLPIVPKSLEFSLELKSKYFVKKGVIFIGS